MGGWERGHSAEGVGADGQAGEPGVMQRVRAMQGDEIPYTGALYPVHRLDRVTSGLLVLGTSNSTVVRALLRSARTEFSRCIALHSVALVTYACFTQASPRLAGRPYSQERGGQPPGV